MCAHIVLDSFLQAHRKLVGMIFQLLLLVFASLVMSTQCTTINMRSLSASNPPKPGYVSVLRDENQNIFSKHTYRVALPLKLTAALREYCIDRGITGIFQKLMNKPLAPAEQKIVELGGADMRWSIYRPDKQWNSNMHWLSPTTSQAHEDYLKALGFAGFDTVLQAIGQEVDHIDGLVCFRLHFIAVSHCTESYMHVDFDGEENRAFNVIIPLILVDGSSPELNVRGDNKPYLVNELKYEENVGVILGDNAAHSTASCDYREKNQMRLAASVYLCDVNILHTFTQGLNNTSKQGDDSAGTHLAAAHWSRGRSNRLPSHQEK